ncbi:UDP-N-acetylglucosamine transferase subunit [Actinomortierella ambigua]|uniref:UDP-N-acetylglucosamine transferase subunit ALG14 n=1 Tax=Actinomortierella ambigua TaxID=1343610 RepID=A0A9P6QJN6_9FUNG|nr:UDP-N-acetylglucosamine transferase subunit [Actinomortierella ambigua]
MSICCAEAWGLSRLLLGAVITAVILALPLALVAALRLRTALPPHRPSKRTTAERKKNDDPARDESPSSEPCNITTTVFLGSGGHTAEMLQLVSGLNRDKYWPRHYIVGWDDDASVTKVHALEQQRFKEQCLFEQSKESTSTKNRPLIAAGLARRGYTIHRVPRSRHVHQSFLTTPFTLLYSLSVAIPMVIRLSCKPLKQGSPHSRSSSTPSSTLLMNGPGTCLALALAVILARMVGVPDNETPDLFFIESFARVKTLSLAGKLLYPLVDHFLVQWPALTQQYPRAEYIGMLV